MALGWDQAVALAAFTLNIPFVAAIPFNGQESRWTKAQIEYYRGLLSLASERYVVSMGEYSVGKLHIRNEWMVNSVAEHDRRGVIALWNGEKDGGTWKCISYAKFRGVRVLNVWDEWEKIQKS